jgi:hypothetical protein
MPQSILIDCVELRGTMCCKDFAAALKPFQARAGGSAGASACPSATNAGRLAHPAPVQAQAGPGTPAPTRQGVSATEVHGRGG